MNDKALETMRAVCVLIQDGHAGSARPTPEQTAQWAGGCLLLIDEIKRLQAEAADFYMAYRMKCDEEHKAQAAERERWQRIANAAQAVTDGATDCTDQFVVPSHLMAALALALDEAHNAGIQARP